MTWWPVARLLHVLFAALWVGGQLTVPLVVPPPARRSRACPAVPCPRFSTGGRTAVCEPVRLTLLRSGAGVRAGRSDGVRRMRGHADVLRSR